MCNLDYMFQLPGLLLHLCCQKEGCRRHGISVEASEGLHHEEAMHVYNGSVDRQLGDVEPLTHVLQQIGSLLPVAQLFISVEPCSAGRALL